MKLTLGRREQRGPHTLWAIRVGGAEWGYVKKTEEGYEALAYGSYFHGKICNLAPQPTLKAIKNALNEAINN